MYGHTVFSSANATHPFYPSQTSEKDLLRGAHALDNVTELDEGVHRIAIPPLATIRLHSLVIMQLKMKHVTGHNAFYARQVDHMCLNG